MENGKMKQIANILEMSSLRAKRGKIWESCVHVQHNGVHLTL